ncbi:MAG: hypothetical protein KF893_04660 [Caldilineaceae bacterium]|nr:hypothetical protein [Caldilineaceae bacterium]
MDQFTRITVPLAKDEFDALREKASKDYRHPREQARYLLRAALGLTDYQENKDAASAVQAGGVFASTR